MNKVFFLATTMLFLGVSCKERADRYPREKDENQQVWVEQQPQHSETETQTPQNPNIITEEDPSTFVSCSGKGNLKADDRLITILSTNDLHGAIEPSQIDKKTVGGLSFLAGVMNSIRHGLVKKYSPSCVGSVLVDGGDQFQGTLLSNYDEGELMFRLLNRIGYDAVVPGNHDYDFGPTGWLVDQITPGYFDQDSKSVIKKLAAQARFPLVSANTYQKNSLTRLDGKQAEIDSVGCASKDPIDWSKAIRPDFLKPYHIKVVADGVRVAMIGLDNPETPKTTTPANVSDLCFRDPFTEYLEIRKELADKADVFVIIMHDGDAKNDFKMSTLLRKLIAHDPYSVDAIVGGHTHFVNQVTEGGIPAIQSGANGEKFGRIDLIYNKKTKKVNRELTKAVAGVNLFHESCDDKANVFCEFKAEKKQLKYESSLVVKDLKSQGMIDQARVVINPMATRLVGEALKKNTRDRINESAVANVLTDALRESTGADIALINTGGIRTDIAEGKVTYESLYRVIPFNNHAVTLSPVDTPALIRLITRSIRTCGSYGSLMGSGIRILFKRNCTQATEGVDNEAKLLTVEMNGEKIYDATGDTPIVKEKKFAIATLDFLASGGSGYVGFKDLLFQKDWGVFREVLVEKLIQSPKTWSGDIDGRWQNIEPTPVR